MKAVYFGEPKRSAWLSMQDTGDGNHAPVGVSLAGDVIIVVIEADADVSCFVTVKRAEGDPTNFVLLPAIESFDVANYCLAADDWLSLEDATYAAQHVQRVTLQLHGSGCR